MVSHLVPKRGHHQCKSADWRPWQRVRRATAAPSVPGMAEGHRLAALSTTTASSGPLEVPESSILCPEEVAGAIQARSAPTRRPTGDTTGRRGRPTHVAHAPHVARSDTALSGRQRPRTVDVAAHTRSRRPLQRVSTASLGDAETASAPTPTHRTWRH